jgi:hypothetical protein
MPISCPEWKTSFPWKFFFVNYLALSSGDEGALLALYLLARA